MAKISTNVLLALILGCAVSPGPASAIETDPSQESIAQLFPSAQHAAVGICFPKYHLELWRDDVIAHKNIDARGSQSKAAGAEPCALSVGNWQRLQRYFRSGTTGGDASGWKPPRVAVTLEGGGSKSAPFAMGALAGLQEAGLLNDVNIISSVSGGSYAAYFYFSRLLDAAKLGAHEKPDPRTWFKDCVPSVYRDHFKAVAPPNVVFCNRNRSLKVKPRTAAESSAAAQSAACALAAPDACEDANTDNIKDYAEAFPYQAHVRFYQDLIYPRGGMRRVNENALDKWATYGNVAWQSLLHVATVPLHTVMNTVLAMPENSSPSRAAYRAGIERAYGHSIHTWQGASAGLPEPVGGAFNEQVFARSPTLADLAAVTGTDVCLGGAVACKVPLWIANASASSGRDLTNWITTPNNDALRASFEMTPFGQGSGIYGFFPQPVTMRLADVVGSSAAFLDRDQREFGTGVLRALAGASISAFNLEWGTDIANYNVAPSAAAAAHVTPFPLYHVSRAREQKSPTIHLSDGGNTDSLGALAALRHGAQNVIVVASTGDGSGNMRSLCRAKNHLELDGTYRVQVPDLARLDWVCSAQIGEHERVVWGDAKIASLVCGTRKDDQLCHPLGSINFASKTWQPDKTIARGYDMWAWTRPILRGWVEREKFDDTGNPLPASGPKNVDRISHIFLIKPGIDTFRALRQFSPPHGHGGALKQLCLPFSDTTRFTIDGCNDTRRMQTPCPPSATHAQRACAQPTDAMPCAALAFSASNYCKAGTTHGAFPQHNVEITTLNSSYTLFGAYFDLGRHAAAQIHWDDNNKTNLLTANEVDAPVFDPAPAMCPK